MAAKEVPQRTPEKAITPIGARMLAFKLIVWPCSVGQLGTGTT
ncbi:MAG: hypothetical protein ABSA81_02760 [Candidatus Bathyarchaeia archaeon]|jgi:hypothetical protein